MQLKMSSGKWRPSFLGLGALDILCASSRYQLVCLRQSHCIFFHINIHWSRIYDVYKESASTINTRWQSPEYHGVTVIDVYVIFIWDHLINLHIFEYAHGSSLGLFVLVRHGSLLLKIVHSCSKGSEPTMRILAFLQTNPHRIMTPVV